VQTQQYRCPNCGAPLQTGQDVSNCNYCGIPKPVKPAPQPIAKPGKEPVKTNLPWYFIAIILLGISGNYVESKSFMDQLLMTTTFVVVMLFIGSFFWYMFRLSRRRFKQTQQ